MSTSPSRSSSPAVTANPNHQIPFNSAPVHHAPSPLGFGFGFGSSFGGNNATTSSLANSSATTPMFGFGASASAHTGPQSTTTSPSRRSDAKRRRDLDEDNDDVDEDEDMAHPQRPRLGSDPFAPSHEHKRVVLLKRMRAGLGFGLINAEASPFPAQPSASSSTSSTFSPSTPNQTHNNALYSSSSFSASKRQALGVSNRVGMSGIDVDIGKMLASMDKPSLLSMLSSLLMQSKDATLPAQILSLLPTPSLDSVESSLDELEKPIRSAIPFVADGTSARHEYTWSRLRAPIAAFVDAALGYLPFFVTELDSDREQRLRERDPRLQADREEVHPATTFTFLLMITSRVLRIEALLPSVTKSSLAFNLFTASSQQTSFGFGGATSTPTSPTKASGGAGASDAYGKHSNLAHMLGTEFASPSSPDALMTVLMPAILKQWTTLLHRLDKAVNGDGRMFSQEVVLNWARGLEATGTAGFGGQSGVKKDVDQPKPEEVLIRKAMDEVRNRLERDLAWLVGGTQHYAVQKRDKRARGSSMSDGARSCDGSIAWFFDGCSFL
ncbi:hypothetical protein EX895_004471 [Sporisorium graminicola]|uniref:Tethering factor for nuclear proteasome STS1 n=1 Tax=Sporisorium graminicola TaxID=280036 RepID=A0A4U7KQZ0_9BASI|nr:hypothetical protein EX895_004471 [Sporisorium graminicola]TKY86830.1 hypothetical protein EX895_004471 [Sporisorium graminicola]